MKSNMPAKGGSASGGKKYFIFAAVFLFSAACAKQPASNNQNQQAQNTQATSGQESRIPPIQLTLKYDNKVYGFIFWLPESWTGYKIYTNNWTGTPLEGSKYLSIVSGRQFNIRHPKWTQAKHYEDIPIMIFTREQWEEVKNQKLSVSAAPFGPSELDSNTQYVFSLPPRYNYDFATGWEEVEQILQNHPLDAYEPLGQKSKNGLWTLVSGDPTDTCAKPTYKGEVKVKGWYVWETTYVEKDWMLRIQDSDLDLLPLEDLGIADSYKDRPYFILVQPSVNLQNSLKQASASSPKEVIVTGFGQYCEGAGYLTAKE